MTGGVKSRWLDVFIRQLLTNKFGRNEGSRPAANSFQVEDLDARGEELETKTTKNKCARKTNETNEMNDHLDT